MRGFLVLVALVVVSAVLAAPLHGEGATSVQDVSASSHNELGESAKDSAKGPLWLPHADQAGYMRHMLKFQEGLAEKARKDPRYVKAFKEQKDPNYSRLYHNAQPNKDKFVAAAKKMKKVYDAQIEEQKKRSKAIDQKIISNFDIQSKAELRQRYEAHVHPDDRFDEEAIKNMKPAKEAQPSEEETNPGKANKGVDDSGSAPADPATAEAANDTPVDATSTPTKPQPTSTSAANDDAGGSDMGESDDVDVSPP